MWSDAESKRLMDFFSSSFFSFFFALKKIAGLLTSRKIYSTSYISITYRVIEKYNRWTVFNSIEAAIRDFLILAEAGIAVAAELKQPEERTEEEKMALLGKPKLGEVSKAQIRIKESKEFKNTVDKLVQRANASILLGKSYIFFLFLNAIEFCPIADSFPFSFSFFLFLFFLSLDLCQNITSSKNQTYTLLYTQTSELLSS